MKRSKIPVVLISFSILIGCQSQAMSDSASTTPATSIPSKPNTVSPTVVNFDTPSLVTETPIATITTTPFPTLPNFLELPLANNSVLFASGTQSCHLPCWQELRPSVSTLDDVQRVFDEVFQMNGKVFLANILDEGMPDSFYNAPTEIYSAELIWVFDEFQEDTGAFKVEMVFDERRILQGTRIWQHPQGKYPAESVQQIITELGRPEIIEVGIGIEGGESGNYNGVLSLHLIYTKGIALQVSYEHGPFPNEQRTYPNLCLNTPPSSSFASLVSSFDLAGEPKTIAQKEWVFDRISAGRWKPIGEQLDMTVEQFTELVSSPYPCINVDYRANRP